MAKSVRFCIQCGEEIGDEAFCSTPDCARVPNFYRNVPAPENVRPRAAGSPAPQGGIATSSAQSPPATTTVGILRDDSTPRTKRETVHLVEPVAVLRGLGDLSESFPIFPGRTEVGAEPPAKILLNRADVSSKHARVVCGTNKQGLWTLGVIDHGSTNGTFVNGDRTKKSVLTDGDRLAFGAAEFSVRYRGEASSERKTVTLDGDH
ncbi:MAG: FHA domain-containing protein [Planctomycetota bacterium]